MFSDKGGGGGDKPKSGVSNIRRPKLNVEKFINKDAIEEVDVNVDDPQIDPLENHSRE